MIEIEIVRNYGVSPLRETPTIEWRIYADYGFRGRHYYPEGFGLTEGLPKQTDGTWDGVSTSQKLMLKELSEQCIFTEEDWAYIISATREWWEV